MVFPEGLATVELRFGEWMDASGRRIDEQITITPPQDLVYTPTGERILQTPVRLPMRYGRLSVTLPATDAPGLSVTGFTYQVTCRGRTVNLSLPAAVPVVDFDLAVPVEPEPGTIVYAPPAGVPGPANSLTIGTVTTGDAGTAAAATLTGQPPSQVLNLTIPRGMNGDGAVIQAGAGLTVSGAGTAASPLVIAQADTGVRKLDVASASLQGNIFFRRVGPAVSVWGNTTTSAPVSGLTAGVKILSLSGSSSPAPTAYMLLGAFFAVGNLDGVLVAGLQSEILLRHHTIDSLASGVAVRFQASWTTTAAFPTTLPGTPA